MSAFLEDNSGGWLWNNSLDDFFGSQDTAKISIGHFRSWKMEAFLDIRYTSESSEDGVELAEGAFGPYDKTSNMSTRSQLQQI